MLAMSETSHQIGRFDSLFRVLDSCEPIRCKGYVSRVSGLLVESTGPNASVGDICWIHARNGGGRKAAEVVGLAEGKILLMPYEDTNGIAVNCEVESTREPLYVNVGLELIGRVVDGFGQPIDGKGPLPQMQKMWIHHEPPSPLVRARISKPLNTGIRAVDSLVTCGEGQRIGIFSGSGVGKSILLGMIGRNSSADVNVIALVGERGREVREFIEKDLGEDGLNRSVVVVVTSNQAAVLRIRGALVATTIAEYFRDRGNNVILMMDSVTRVAMAQREIGLAAGEPPTTKGYTPSVFAFLPRLLERAGTSDRGQITGFYTVLVEADDMSDPVADSVRSILDGHMVLSRKLASQNHYPAIDVLNSVSRVMVDVVSPEHLKAATAVREALATYREAEDLINIGAYAKGSNPKIDRAIELFEKIEQHLQQGMSEKATFEQSVNSLMELT